MTAPLDARAAATLLQGYVAPAVELLCNAVEPGPGAVTVIMGPWVGMCLSAFEERHSKGRYVALENLPPPTLGPMQRVRPLAYGSALRSPVRPDALGGLVQSLSLWDASLDAGALRECVRMLAPSGSFAAAFLMRGTFDAFFDAAREACETAALGDAAAALAETENQFRHPDALRTAASRSGLMNVELGLEERALPFANAQEFLMDPAVGQVLLRNFNLPLGPVRTHLMQAVEQSLNTYFAGVAMHARVVTGVLRGIKPASN